MNKNKFSYIPYLFVGFMLLIVAVDATYIYIAHNTYAGVYTKNHYQKGIDYARANSSGLMSKEDAVKVEAVISGAQMQFNVSEQGKKVSFDDVAVKVIRPVNKVEDMVLEIQNRESGSFNVDLSGLANGQWELRVKLTKSGEDFYNKFRILKRDSKIRIKKDIKL